jgi:integrase
MELQPARSPSKDRPPRTLARNTVRNIHAAIRAMLRGVVDDGLLQFNPAEKLKHGWPEMPPWVFCTTGGTPFDDANVRKAMARVLNAAKLPAHFTPPCLRHTFASLLLQQGESVVSCNASSGTPRFS